MSSKRIHEASRSERDARRHSWGVSMLGGGGILSSSGSASGRIPAGRAGLLASENNGGGVMGGGSEPPVNSSSSSDDDDDDDERSSASSQSAVDNGDPRNGNGGGSGGGRERRGRRRGSNSSVSSSNNAEVGDMDDNSADRHTMWEMEGLDEDEDDSAIQPMHHHHDSGTGSGSSSLHNSQALHQLTQHNHGVLNAREHTREWLRSSAHVTSPPPGSLSPNFLMPPPPMTGMSDAMSIDVGAAHNSANPDDDDLEKRFGSPRSVASSPSGRIISHRYLRSASVEPVHINAESTVGLLHRGFQRRVSLSEAGAPINHRIHEIQDEEKRSDEPGTVAAAVVPPSPPMAALPLPASSQPFPYSRDASPSRSISRSESIASEYSSSQLQIPNIFIPPPSASPSRSPSPLSSPAPSPRSNYAQPLRLKRKGSFSEDQTAPSSAKRLLLRSPPLNHTSSPIVPSLLNPDVPSARPDLHHLEFRLDDDHVSMDVQRPINSPPQHASSFPSSATLSPPITNAILRSLPSPSASGSFTFSIGTNTSTTTTRPSSSTSSIASTPPPAVLQKQQHPLRLPDSTTNNGDSSMTL